MPTYEYFDVKCTITQTIKCKPENIQKRHDEFAKTVINAVSKALGGKPQYIKDCNTGKFRRL